MSCKCIGESLRRKFKDIKTIVTNDFSSMYARNLPGGRPPSGKSVEDILLSTRHVFFDNIA